jgi:hypothetical protein
MWQENGITLMNTVLFWGRYGGKRQLGRDLCIDWRTILNLILNKFDVRALTGFIWLRINTSGGL